MTHAELVAALNAERHNGTWWANRQHTRPPHDDPDTARQRLTTATRELHRPER